MDLLETGGNRASFQYEFVLQHHLMRGCGVLLKMDTFYYLHYIFRQFDLAIFYYTSLQDKKRLSVGDDDDDDGIHFILGYLSNQ